MKRNFSTGLSPYFSFNTDMKLLEDEDATRSLRLLDTISVQWDKELQKWSSRLELDRSDEETYYASPIFMFLKPAWSQCHKQDKCFYPQWF